MSLRDYLRGVVTLDPTEYPFGSMIRALWKGVFEFIRNLVVIAFLKYVALKTGSPYVIFLFELSTFALACYLISFMSISFNLFPFAAQLRRQRPGGVQHRTHLVVAQRDHVVIPIPP